MFGIKKCDGKEFAPLKALFKRYGQDFNRVQIKESPTVNAVYLPFIGLLIFSGIRDKCNDDEIFAVLMHEEGHRNGFKRLRHTLNSIIWLFIGVLFLFLSLASIILTIPAYLSGNAFLLFGAIADAFVFKLLFSWAITRYKQGDETFADDYATKIRKSNRKWLISALEKFGKANVVPAASGVQALLTIVYWLLFYPFNSHPPIPNRVARIRALDV